jgi:hypothetical protein
MEAPVTHREVTEEEEAVVDIMEVAVAQLEQEAQVPEEVVVGHHWYLMEAQPLVITERVMARSPSRTWR